MAASATLAKETMLGGKRCKLYKVTHDGSDVGLTILAGRGYTVPFGSYISYSVGSQATGAFAFSIKAGAANMYSIIGFLAP